MLFNGHDKRANTIKPLSKGRNQTRKKRLLLTYSIIHLFVLFLNKQQIIEKNR